jgi:spore germination protein KA
MFWKKRKSQHEQKEINSNILAFDSLEENSAYIEDSFNKTSDLSTRNFTFNHKLARLMYLETVCDSEKIQTTFLTPISENQTGSLENVMTAANVLETKDLHQVIIKMLRGHCVIITEDEKSFYLFNAQKINNRTPEEPSNEKVVRGSHQGFVENIEINLNLIRNRITNRQLTIQYMEMGTETNTKIALCYMNGLADERSKNKILERLQNISSDMLFSPGYLEEFIEDKPFSPFPQTLYTERPDRVMAQLMDGRIAIFADGSSDVIIAPTTFFSFFQTPDDYNSRVFAGSFFRLIRFISFLVAVTFPALYIAVIAFHFEVIPNEIIVLVKGSVESIPFPPLIEAIIMAFTIELIREAGVRLPTPIGQTIGIVGGLIIGDAVINAGLISNIMVIIIAITAVSSFTIPSYEMSTSIRLLTFPLMMAAASLGFLGIIFSLMFIVAHLCKLESFGKPYFAPIAPLTITDLRDTFVRFPNWMFNRRPLDTDAKVLKRQRTIREWKKDDE